MKEVTYFFRAYVQKGKQEIHTIMQDSKLKCMLESEIERYKYARKQAKKEARKQGRKTNN